MALPKPSQLEGEVAEILEGLAKLASDYKWGHSLLYGVRGAQPEPTDGNTKGKAMPSRGDIAFSDPTGNTALDREGIRSNMKYAHVRVLEITKQVEKGLRALENVFGNRGSAPESTYICSKCQRVTHGPLGQHNDPCPRCGSGRLRDVTGDALVSDDELAKTREAKRKREASGGGFGES